MSISKKESVVKGCIKTAFAGIKPSWKKLFLSKKIKPLLRKCFSKLDAKLLSHGVTREMVELVWIRTLY